jgi:hypothetical protein
MNREDCGLTLCDYCVGIFDLIFSEMCKVQEELNKAMKVYIILTIHFSL